MKKRGNENYKPSNPRFRCACGGRKGYRSKMCFACRQRTRNPDSTDTHKRCPQCRLVKLRDEFSPKSKANPGDISWCRECTRIRLRESERSRLGATPERFRKIWIEQHGCCAGCRSPLIDGPNCHLDHDHTTGRVRGILCRTCNLALGNVNDDVQTLLRLAAYLERAL